MHVLRSVLHELPIIPEIHDVDWRLAFVLSSDETLKYRVLVTAQAGCCVGSYNSLTRVVR